MRNVCIKLSRKFIDNAYIRCLNNNFILIILYKQYIIHVKNKDMHELHFYQKNIEHFKIIRNEYIYFLTTLYKYINTN